MPATSPRRYVPLPTSKSTNALGALGCELRGSDCSDLCSGLWGPQNGQYTNAIKCSLCPHAPWAPDSWDLMKRLRRPAFFFSSSVYWKRLQGRRVKSWVWAYGPKNFVKSRRTPLTNPAGTKETSTKSDPIANPHFLVPSSGWRGLANCNEYIIQYYTETCPKLAEKFAEKSC